MSSKLAPSETPSSFSAFSTDISNGAESSALEPARTGDAVLVNVRREWKKEPRQARFTIDFPIGVDSNRRTGGVGKAEPAERRLGRTERVAAIFR